MQGFQLAAENRAHHQRREGSILGDGICLGERRRHSRIQPTIIHHKYVVRFTEDFIALLQREYNIHVQRQREQHEREREQRERERQREQHEREQRERANSRQSTACTQS